MKRFVSAAAVFALAAPLALAQSSTWVADSHHSEVDFQVTHLSISNVHGHFGGVAATIVYDDKNIANSSVKASVDVSTIDTGDQARDTHLTSPDFFDAPNNSTATFVSTSVKKGGNGLIVDGNLTLHGVTKPVELNVSGPRGPVENPMDHHQHAGFTATTTIKRSDFGIGSKFPAAMVGDDVQLTFELDVAKQ